MPVLDIDIAWSLMDIDMFVWTALSLVGGYLCKFRIEWPRLELAREVCTRSPIVLAIMSRFPGFVLEEGVQGVEGWTRGKEG